ncbi:hypothetical protein PCE1_000517 [Barthelona sp. PCE]
MTTASNTGSVSRAVILGQICAWATSTSSLVSQKLSKEYGFSFPSFQILLTYMILALFNLKKKNIKISRKTSLLFWVYSTADVMANYLVVRAFRQTTIVSVTIILWFSTPVVFIASVLFLKHRYTFTHWAMCALTLAAVVTQILGSGSFDSLCHSRLAGNLFALGAALLYGTSNIMLEVQLKDVDSLTDLWAHLGMRGLPLALAIFFAAEYKCFVNFDFVEGKNIMLLVLLFTFLLMCVYCFAPLVVRFKSAALLCLSMLFNNAWSVFYNYFFFCDKINIREIISLFCLVISVSVFTLKDEKKPKGGVSINYENV